MTTLDPVAQRFKDLAHQVWYWPVVRGVLAVVLGVVALVWPGVTVVVIAMVVGAYAVVDGIFSLVEAVRYRALGGTALRVTLGLLTVGLGLLLLFWPGKSVTVVVWLLGLWAVLAGIVQLAAAVWLRRVPGSGWGWGVAVGLATLLFGILVLVNVQAGIVAIVWIVAVYAIVLGILLVVLGLRIRALGKAL